MNQSLYAKYAVYTVYKYLCYDDFRRHIYPNPPPGNDIELKEPGCSSDVKVVDKESKQKEPRLFWAMMKAFGMKALVAALFKLVFDILQFLSPLIMK